jgi:hypothetical protein
MASIPVDSSASQPSSQNRLLKSFSFPHPDPLPGGEGAHLRAGQAARDIAADLLAHLRQRLGASTLTYAEGPTRIVGGYDTLVYSFQLDGGPDAFLGPLILRAFRDDKGPERARWEHTGGPKHER